MRGLEAGALAVDLAPGVGLVQLDVLEVRRPADDHTSLRAVLETLEDLVLHVDAPGVVVLSGLEHRARGRHGIAAALHLDRVEVRTMRDVVGRIDLGVQDVARFEIAEPVRPGPDRPEIRRRLARPAAPERLEDVAR